MNHEELALKVEHAFASEFNMTYHAYIDITGDLIAGTLLSQIMYWFNPDKNGKRRVRIYKDGSFWLAKKRDDWYSEIRISPKQYDRAIKILVDMGLVEVKRFKFNGDPITHIRPLNENIYAEVKKWKRKKAETIVKAYSTKEEKPTESKDEQGGNSFFTFGEIPTSEKVKNQLDDTVSSLTEITTETTTETTSKDIYTSAELMDTDDFFGVTESVTKNNTSNVTEKQKKPDAKKTTGKKVLYEGKEYHTRQDICNLVKDLYNEKCQSLVGVRVLTDKREKAIMKLVSKYGIGQMVEVFEFAENDDFCKGKKSSGEHKGWKADFDFVLREDQFAKLLDRKYSNGNKGGSYGRPTENSTIAYLKRQAEQNPDSRLNLLFEEL